MPLWTAAAAPRPGSAPRCTCAFNYSASEPLHVGLDDQHLLHVKLQRSPAGGYSRLARQHLNAAPFPCRTAPGFICKQLIPVTEVVCLLHRRIGGAGELGGAVTDLENETENLKCGFAGKPAAFVDTVQRPFVVTSFASHTCGDVVIPSSRGSAAQATRLEESHFWTAYSLLIRAYF